MKRRGFTLIELLAVIVILAIIALIATPIVLDIIADTKKSAAERTADNYIKQVENAIATANLENKLISNGTYKIEKDGNICPLVGCGENDKDKIKVKMNGEKPKGGSIVISNGQVTTDSSFIIGDYTIAYNPTNNKYEATEKSNALVLCKAVTELSTQTYNSNFDGNSHTEKTGVLASDGDPYAYGVEYTCELGDGEQNTFYVLDSSNDTVSLIINKNIKEEDDGAYSVIWCNDDDVAAGTCNSLGVKESLSNRTKKWTKLTSDQITIPTEAQIKAQIIKGTTIFGKEAEMTKPWLCENFGYNDMGYWVYDIMKVSSYGALINDGVRADAYIGIRPVITISKSQLG